MEKKNTDWSISDLYRKSWEIIKNNKILWIFGMATVSLSSGSNSGSGRFDSLKEIFQNNNASTGSDKVNQVLGASTNTFTDTLNNLFFAVPIWLYILLGLGIVLLILASIVLGVIYQAWVSGALISGVNIAATGQKPTISQSSHLSFPAIKGLIWVNLVPSLIFFVVTFVVLGLLILGIVILPSLAKAIPILFMVIAVFAALISWIFINLTQTFASRRVVLEKKPGSQSFSSSFKIVKKKFWRMLGLGLVNTLLSLVVMLIVAIPILIVGGVALLGIIFTKAPNPSLVGTLVVAATVLILVYFLGYTIFSGILNSFKASVWTLAYNHIKGEYDEE